MRGIYKVSRAFRKLCRVLYVHNLHTSRPPTYLQVSSLRVADWNEALRAIGMGLLYICVPAYICTYVYLDSIAPLGLT